MDLEKLVKTTTQELEKLVSTDTVIGKPQTFEGKTVIPVNKIQFGFGAGGGTGEGKCKEKDNFGSGEGGGVGAGAGVEPIAFLVVDKDGVKVFPLRHKGSIATAIEALVEKCPGIMEKGMEMESKMKEMKKGEKKKK